MRFKATCSLGQVNHPLESKFVSVCTSLSAHPSLPVDPLIHHWSLRSVSCSSKRQVRPTLHYSYCCILYRPLSRLTAAHVLKSVLRSLLLAATKCTLYRFRPFVVLSGVSVIEGAVRYNCKSETPFPYPSSQLGHGLQPGIRFTELLSEIIIDRLLCFENFDRLNDG